MPATATSPPRALRHYLLALGSADWRLLQRLARHHQTTKAAVLRRSLREWAKQQPSIRAT